MFHLLYITLITIYYLRKIHRTQIPKLLEQLTHIWTRGIQYVLKSETHSRPVVFNPVLQGQESREGFLSHQENCCFQQGPLSLVKTGVGQKTWLEGRSSRTGLS